MYEKFNKKPSSQFWSSASMLKETLRRVLERESGIGGNPMEQGPESRPDVEESPIPVEFLNGRFRHVCSVWSGVVLKNHSMSSTRAFLLDCFLQTAKLLTIAFSSDGQVPLKQFIMDNPLHIPPDAAPSAECHSWKNCLA
jgi:hypothetical protein